MTTQGKRLWKTMAAVSSGLILGVGATIWLAPPSPRPDTHVHAGVQQDHRLVKLEQAVTALTNALQVSKTTNTRPEPTCSATPASGDVSRQSLAQLIRTELRQVLAEASPEARRAREEALANAEVLNSPENRVAYQSASDVVHAAVATRRWTEEDKETFREAFLRLTNDQRAELMDILAPAINGGEIAVEVNGLLF